MARQVNLALAFNRQMRLTDFFGAGLDPGLHCELTGKLTSHEHGDLLIQIFMVATQAPGSVEFHRGRYQVLITLVREDITKNWQ